MTANLVKVWKDELNRRWYLFDTDPYPYISVSSVVAIAKAYRYKDFSKDEKGAKRLKQAGQKGTDIHAVLEKHNRDILGQPFDIDTKLQARYSQILENYIEKVKLISMNEGEVKIIDVERRTIHPVYKVAGRFDVLVTVGGEYEVWDYKTSRKVHEEDGWQLVMYMMSLRLEGIDVKRVRIIHIDKVSAKITDLKYVHHDYMFNKFLCCLEIFKGIYFNDLLKGRISDIEDLGVKYKWPLEELTKNYVLCYNLSKGDNNMELKEVTGIGEGKTFTKDPNRVNFNEVVTGVVLGNVPSRWVHKAGKDKVFVCEGKDRCERCKLGMKKTVQFKANFLTVDDTDKPVIKKIESESIRFFFALSDAFKKIKDEGGDLKTAVLSIERTGEKFETQYKVENVAPKHRAFKDIAATIEPMQPFELTFTQPSEETGAQVDRTDIVDVK